MLKKDKVRRELRSILDHTHTKKPISRNASSSQHQNIGIPAAWHILKH